jgi:hypothetical protein
MQEIPESVQATINAIHAELKSKPVALKGLGNATKCYQVERSGKMDSAVED